MGWTAFKLVYQAKSPIHIGSNTLGYIKLTRYYITGKAIWGAMTANITRALYKYEDYTNIGKLLKEGIFTSYFFPAVGPNPPLLPRFTDIGLMYGPDNKMPESEFERIFIKSYGQTAVMPHSNTAEDETLHESEYMSPCVEIDGCQRQVVFVGYIFISDGADYKGKINIQKIKKPISEIFVGGDRKYGWGRLSLFGEPQECEDIFSYKIQDMEAGNLKISLGLNDLIPAHLSVSPDAKLKGDIEPLVGMEFETGKGFGRKISKAKTCWVPGSIVAADEMTLTIGAHGILENGDNLGK